MLSSWTFKPMSGRGGYSPGIAHRCRTTVPRHGEFVANCRKFARAADLAGCCKTLGLLGCRYDSLGLQQRGLICMRGGDERTGSLFSSVDLQAGVPAGHPLRAMLRLVNASLGWVVRRALCQDGSAVDRAGTAVAGCAAADAVFGPLRAAIDGAARVRPIVPLVRGSWDR